MSRPRFNRTYGTKATWVIHNHSTKVLGHHPMSLRDNNHDGCIIFIYLSRPNRQSSRPMQSALEKMMNIEKEFEEELLNNYKKVGKELEYRAHISIGRSRITVGWKPQNVCLQRNSTIHLIKKDSKSSSRQEGYICPLNLVLNNRFRKLFTGKEIIEANSRSNIVPEQEKRRPIAPEDNHPDT